VGRAPPTIKIPLFSGKNVQVIKHGVFEQDKSPSGSPRSRKQSRRGDRLRILFTEGASLSARQTLYPLGGRYEIDVMDPDPLCQCRCSSFVRRFYRSPSFAREPTAFLRFLDQLVRQRRHDVVLPTHEQVYLLSRFRDSIAQRVGLAMPPFESLQRLQNKAEFSRLLTELGLPQPETACVRGRRGLDRTWSYPCYLKLPHSTAGSGVFLVAGREELDRRLHELETRHLLDADSEILVQQPARGVLSTVQAVFNRGQLIGVHTFEARRLGVGGMSTARISADHAVVREHVAKIGQHLDWHGAFFIDYFFDRATVRPEYIECNPRIGETVNALLSGINLPELLVRISRGDSPSPQPHGRDGVQTHNLLMILMSAAHDGQSRGALLHEIRECAAGRGLYADSQDELIRPQEDHLSRLPRIWITTQLLAYPRIAGRIVAKTIANYALPEAATNTIKALPLDLLEQYS
jgi:predicted ATP-grasp superfamily ATP-dependent carboligase